MKKLKHIAFIMDGNNRWSNSKGLHFSEGHKRGLEVLENILEHCIDKGIEVISLYAFSSENWKRSEDEKKVLFELLYNYFNINEIPENNQGKNKINTLIERDARIKIIGNISRFPKHIVEVLKNSEETSKHHKKHLIQIALSYGGRDEIIRATKKIAKLVQNGEVSPEDINENFFGQFLDTNGTPDPDFLIRTSGEHRVSNFLPFQIAYSELFFTPTLWPDFNVKELDEAIEEFFKRERRYGGRL